MKKLIQNKIYYAPKCSTKLHIYLPEISHHELKTTEGPDTVYWAVEARKLC